MDLQIKIDLALEIINFLIATESMIDASENNNILNELLFERALVINKQEEIIDHIIREYAPIIKKGESI